MYGKGEGLLCYATDADQRALLDAHEGFRPGLPASEKADLRWRDYAVLLDLVRLVAFVSGNGSPPKTKKSLDASAALSPPLLGPVSEDVGKLASEVDSLADAGTSPPLPDGFTTERPANRLVALLAGTRLWPAAAKAATVDDFGKRVSSASRFARGSAAKVTTVPVVVFRRRTGSRSAQAYEWSTKGDGTKVGSPHPVTERIPTEIYPGASMPGVTNQVRLFSKVFGCSPADLGVDVSSMGLFDHEVNGGFVSASPLSSGLVDACYDAVGVLLECDVLLLGGSARAAMVPGHRTTVRFDYSRSGSYNTDTGYDTRRDPDLEYVADPGDEANVRPAACTVDMTYSWHDGESTEWHHPGYTFGSVSTYLHVTQTVSDTAAEDPAECPLDSMLAFSVPDGLLDPFVDDAGGETGDAPVASGTVVMPVSLHAHVYSSSSESNEYTVAKIDEGDRDLEEYRAGYSKSESSWEDVTATVVVPVAVTASKDEETGEWMLVSEKATLEDVVRAAWEAADAPDGVIVVKVPSSCEKPKFAPDVTRRTGSGGNFYNRGGGDVYYNSTLEVRLGAVGDLSGMDDDGETCGYPTESRPGRGTTGGVPWLKTAAVLKMNPRIRRTVFGG